MEMEKMTFLEKLVHNYRLLAGKCLICGRPLPAFRDHTAWGSCHLQCWEWSDQPDEESDWSW